MMLVASASKSSIGKRRCLAQEFEMEILVAARANLCTTADLEKIHTSLDKVLYQIFPVIPGLVKADITNCIVVASEGEEAGVSDRRSLQRQREPEDKAYRRCDFCFDDDGDRRRLLGRRRHLMEKACRQWWTKLYDSTKNQWDDDSWRNKKVLVLPNGQTHLGPYTSGNVFYKTIRFSRRITYLKVDFEIFQNNGVEWDNNDIIEVSINKRQYPIQLRYVDTAEDTRFRKNGILSAAEHYIKNDEGNIQYTKVVLHIDLSSIDSRKLLLRFQIKTLDSDATFDSIKEAITLGQMKIKGTNACAISSSMLNNGSSNNNNNNNNNNNGMMTMTSIDVYEQETEWALSEKLTAVVKAKSKSNKNHCLHDKDPSVYVNLFKIDESTAPLCVAV